jgi:hypothetical protein
LEVNTVETEILVGVLVSPAVPFLDPFLTLLTTLSEKLTLPFIPSAGFLLPLFTDLFCCAAHCVAP